LGEVGDIIDTLIALMGSFMKIVGGIERNSGNISQGFKLMEDAYKSLQNVQKLLTDPSTAASAGLNPRLENSAQKFITDRVASAESMARIMPRAATPAFPVRRQLVGGKKMKSRRYLKDPKKFKTYIAKIRNKTAKKEAELINSIRELKNM
jgi:hypothetical protein